ncbi:Hypothetical_protein [Hexamita inflata]|uniref:Hypothetical_protein n=1 Tax=Hexamita inflata TaxID=28002 RepID=A0ABP1IAC0_9EUKA
MSVLMRRENTLIIEPGSDISKIQIINFILLPNSKKHFEGPPLYDLHSKYFWCEIYQHNRLQKCKMICQIISIYLIKMEKMKIFTNQNTKLDIFQLLAQHGLIQRTPTINR